MGAYKHSTTMLSISLKLRSSPSGDRNLLLKRKVLA